MGGRGPLVTKLSHFVALSDEDVRVLDALCVKEERFEADIDIAVQGDVPRSAFVLTRGMAFRYRLLPDGKRQILTFMIPGDVFGLHAFLLRAMDHSIGTLVPTRLAAISRARVFELFERHPRIGAALWWSALQEEAINRERIVALGRRSARGRVAYLMCEALWRQKAVGLAEHHAIRLPLTQSELADALGLTSVHLNRILQGFRRDNLIALVLAADRGGADPSKHDRSFLDLGGYLLEDYPRLLDAERPDHDRRDHRARNQQPQEPTQMVRAPHIEWAEQRHPAPSAEMP
jgi:CRP-like cAMP-binding protein